MKCILILQLIFVFFSLPLTSQDTFCANHLFHEKYISVDDNYWTKKEALNEFTKQWAADYSKERDDVVKTITVVVHVLYQDTIDNISEEQIYSGLEVLNEDFRQLNPDFTSTPSVFKPFAADCEIEFCLTKMDEFGNASNGITRKQIPESFDVFYNYFDENLGGKKPWDNRRFMNIWIVDLTSVGMGVGGFGQPPSAIGEDFDGIVVDYRYWGRIEQGASIQHFDKGRTASHEVGHYLNLEHPWGLEYGCQEGDFVDDTPTQYEPVFGCPNVPVYDSCTTTGNGLIFSNFMDYTLPACRTLFTMGQKERMLATLAGPRQSLIEGSICDQMTATQEEHQNLAVEIYPNPADDYLRLIIYKNFTSPHSIVINDLLGRIVLHMKINDKTWYEIGGERRSVNLSLPKKLQGLFFVNIANESGAILTTHRILIN